MITFFGMPPRWAFDWGMGEIMRLSYILPMIFLCFWIILFIKVLADIYVKNSNIKITLILFKLTTMLFLMTIILEIFIGVFDNWYEIQWVLVVLELATLPVWFLFKKYPKHSIIILLVMLLLTLIISIPEATFNYNELHHVDPPCFINNGDKMSLSNCIAD